jgi:hypothetical protein
MRIMSWGARRLQSGIECRYLDAAADAPEAAHWAVLERSTALIPVAHRSLVRHVELRGRNQAPSSGGGSDRAAGVIRLSHASLRAPYNRNYNVTLLHEFGHHVDWRYDLVRYVQGRSAEGRALLSTRHNGATQGPGERIADCYMIYLLQVVAGQNYTHPADPEAYRGTAARARFTLLVQSPAFAGLPGYRDWQSSTAV